MISFASERFPYLCDPGECRWNSKVIQLLKNIYIYYKQDLILLHAHRLRLNIKEYCFIILDWLSALLSLLLSRLWSEQDTKNDFDSLEREVWVLSCNWNTAGVHHAVRRHCRLITQSWGCKIFNAKNLFKRQVCWTWNSEMWVHFALTHDVECLGVSFHYRNTTRRPHYRGKNHQ